MILVIMEVIFLYYNNDININDVEIKNYKKGIIQKTIFLIHTLLY